MKRWTIIFFVVLMIMTMAKAEVVETTAEPETTVCTGLL